MKKITLSIILAISLLAVTAGTVFAQDTTTTPTTGTVQFIVPETDATTAETTVLVSYMDDMGVTYTVRLSLDTATNLGLVTTDATTGITTANDAAVGTTVTIDPATVITDAATEEDLHPVGSALSDFFSELLGVDYDTIMTNHDEGTGFGVIAQALWMTNSLEGDTSTFQAILDAKKSGDYSAITLADGSTPTNWGQFRKAVTDDKEKAKQNLGSIRSGHAENGLTSNDQTLDGDDGNEKAAGRDNGKGKKDKDKKNK